MDENVEIVNVDESDDFDNMNEFRNENLYESRDDTSSEHVNVLYLKMFSTPSSQ